MLTLENRLYYIVSGRKHRLWEKARAVTDPSLQAGVSWRRLLDGSHLGLSVHSDQSWRISPRLLTMGKKTPKRTRQGFLGHLKGTHGRWTGNALVSALASLRAEMKRSSARRVELLRCKKFSEDLGYEDGSH